MRHIVEEQCLYIKDNTGAMRVWGISAVEDKITIRYGQVDGTMQYQTEHVAEGKQSRTLYEQVESRIASRISKQKDKGYIENYFVAERRNVNLNAIGRVKPMLAQKSEKVRNVDYRDAIIQPKFDGNRCLIYCEGGINYAYSRNGKPIEAISHILQDMDLPEGMTVDGELYCHGQPLQTIVSWIKRAQADTARLKYHLYDVVDRHLAYKERSDIIRGLPLGESISPVYGTPISCKEDVFRYFRAYRSQGYEGAILRWGDTGYEVGKRSQSLVKIKEWQSDEFKVIDVIPSSEGWAILVCETFEGMKFKVSAPGTIYQKIEILNNSDNYIGKNVTVEYANLTKDGIPFHPIAVNFRDDI